MKRPGVVLLLLLLTSAAAVQYHWQATVSLHGPAVQTTSAVSEAVCAIHCKGLPSEECSGFTYEAGDGTCRLFSGDCRGPAADISQQTTDRYMGRNLCPGTSSDLCGCPAGFSRCAGRCLARLNSRLNYADAEAACAELGAHLAVPRSEAENKCAVATNAAVSVTTWVWLGLTDVVTEDRFVGVDGCGVVTSADPVWFSGEPTNSVDQNGAVLAPVPYAGWHDAAVSSEVFPLCQLSFCYQSGCQ